MSPRAPRSGWSLLQSISDEALDPEYRTTTHRGQHTPRGRVVVAAVLVLIGLMLGSSAAATARTQPAAANERAQLIGYIKAGEKQNDAERDQIQSLRTEISQLQRDNLGSGERADELRRQLAELETAAGVVAVTGPGLTITIDDADDSGAGSGRLLDVDLRQAVNGLWLAGAEAVAVNGHRITSLTSIRAAGDAITVDYRSLVRPYVITAIGDPHTLPARWVSSPGASWLNYLKVNYRVRYDWTQQPSLTLPAGQAVAVRHAVAEPPK